MTRRAWTALTLALAFATARLDAQAGPVRLSADDAVHRALATSHALRAKRDETDAVRFGLSAESADMLPHLMLVAQRAGQQVFDTAGLNVPQFLALPNFPTNIINRLYTRASLVVPLTDYALRLRPLQAAGACTVDAARRSEETTALAIESATRTAYYEWIKAALRSSFADQLQHRASAHLAVALSARRAGTTLDADVLRLRADSAAAAAEIARAVGDVEIATATLQLLTHDPAGTIYEPSSPAEESGASDESLTALLAEAQRRRPEPRELEATAAALSKQSRAERGGTYPQLEGFVEIVSANPHPDLVSITNNRYNTWEFGLRAVWSTTNLRAGSATARAYGARAAGAKEEAAVMRDSLRAEVVRAYSQLKQTRAVVGALRAAKDASAEALYVRAAQSRRGDVTPAQLADTEVEAARSVVELQTAWADVRIAEARLARAVGRGSAAPLASGCGR
ncbi:MAG: TolC family protein [Gemmatimonadota bacterium]|nr:TolC family protein [Gemmatimonadota bacterium]